MIVLEEKRPWRDSEEDEQDDVAAGGQRAPPLHGPLASSSVESIENFAPRGLAQVTLPPSEKGTAGGTSRDDLREAARVPTRPLA